MTSDIGAYEAQAQVIVALPHEFEFMAIAGGDSPKPQNMYIRNKAPDSLSWEINSTCPWLEIDPNQGESDDITDMITLRIDTTNLSIGNYSGTLTITANQAYNSPLTLPVTLKIRPGRYVPSVYGTIQAAINASNNEDIVLVEPQVYHEYIQFNGKNIILTSTDPDDPNIVANTVIQGNGTTSVVTFTGGESASCQLVGFTITGGAGATLGGGIVGNNTNTNPTISQCVITGNSSTSAGGGIWGCGGKISRCVFSNNSTNYGGGIAACHGTIMNCIIRNNHATYGGAINNCDGNIFNCTITQNTATNPGALNSCDGNITNCIIWGNSSDSFSNHTTGVRTYCCWPWGTSGTGNIAKNPMFVSSADFHLLPSSPCIDAGDPSFDWFREPLPNGFRINMGAYGNTLEATPTWVCDLKRDGFINLEDFSVVAHDWLQEHSSGNCQVN